MREAIRRSSNAIKRQSEFISGSWVVVSRLEPADSRRVVARMQREHLSEPTGAVEVHRERLHPCMVGLRRARGKREVSER